MTGAREQILAAVAAANADRDRSLTDYGSVSNLRPLLTTEPFELFKKQARANSATVQEVSGTDVIGRAVSEYLKQNKLAGKICVAGNVARDQPVWPQALNVRIGLPSSHEQVGLSTALAGVAETGSVVLCSGPDAPTTLNFLPDHHLVLLDKKDIVKHIEDVWPIFRRMEVWPRTINFVTGPSRTADIEQTILLGAHGPRRLHILLLNSQGTSE